MKKSILIVLLLSGFCPKAFSQLSPAQMDSLKIDSLKRKLPSLKGTNRIDCMTVLCEYYFDGAPIAKTSPHDSLKKYGAAVLSESKAINYKRGTALGLLASGPDSFALKEKNARQAMRIGEEINDDQVLTIVQ